MSWDFMLEEPVEYWEEQYPDPDADVRCCGCGATYYEACEENCSGGAR